MTIEKLLQTRIKCIAPFLGMRQQGWEFGQILTIEEIDDLEFNISLPKKYPINFKKLEWWEERGENDFDELKFVKTHAGNSVKTVLRLELRLNKIVLDGGKVRPISHWVPATEQEYNTIHSILPALPTIKKFIGEAKF